MAQLITNPSGRALSSLLTGQEIQSWYRNDISGSTFSPAQSAYISATNFFRTNLTQDECKRIWLADKPTMQDVIGAVESARGEYEARNKGRGKVREYLTAFSSRVMYYGAIMDTLSQHHPEYVSLAWGAMKFLFIGVLNHEEILTSIAKTLTRIADVLPRAELHLILYPTTAMLNAVSAVYAHIIKFIEFAVRWYKKGKIAHGIAAILKPFQIAGKEAAENIAESSRHVDRLASAASKAELRELHLKVIELTNFAMESRALNARISVDVKTIMSNQVSQILSLPAIKQLPEAQKTLEFHQAMRNRHRLRQRNTHTYAHLLPSLSQWVSDTSDKLLLAQAKHDPKSAKYFATDVVETIQEAHIPVIWALPARHSQSRETLLVDVIRAITVQALQIKRPSLGNVERPISSSEVESATTEQEWLLLLKRAIDGLVRLFVVIDTDILKDDNRGTQNRAVQLMDRLLELCRGGPNIKIMLITRRFKGSMQHGDVDEEDHYVRLFTDSEARGNARRRKAAVQAGRKSARREGLVLRPKRMALALKPAFTDPQLTHNRNIADADDSEYD